MNFKDKDVFTTNENEKNLLNGTRSECLGDIIYNAIVFPRKLINEARTIFQPYYKEDLPDENIAMILYKLAKLEILLQKINEGNAHKITATNKEPKEEIKND